MIDRIDIRLATQGGWRPWHSKARAFCETPPDHLSRVSEWAHAYQSSLDIGQLRSEARPRRACRRCRPVSGRLQRRPRRNRSVPMLCICCAAFGRMTPFPTKFPSEGHILTVGATGLEPAISCSQSRRASHYATPRDRRLSLEASDVGAKSPGFRPEPLSATNPDGPR